MTRAALPARSASSVPSGSRRRRWWSDAAIVTASALVLRLAVVGWAWGRFPAVADGFYYHRLAQRLAAGQGYSWLWPDGSVSFVAHYPVGYPALLAGAYALFGGSVGVAMLLNATLGSGAVLAVHRLLARLRCRPIAALGATLVAVHPALLAYTPALMTEGACACALAFAGWAALGARHVRSWRRRLAAWLGIGLLVGAGTLLRPESLLFAPCFGVLAARAGARRWLAALLVTLSTLAVCAPWTVRNYQRFGYLVPISANGGWNLLIGTQARGGGGWSPLRVPASCRGVYDEALKDRCYARAGWEQITRQPWNWLALAPRKLGHSLDYVGGGGWYLRTANPKTFDRCDQALLGASATVFQRLVLIAALVATWPRRCGTRRRWRRVVAGLGIAAAFTPAGWVAYLALVTALALRRPCPWRSASVHGLCLVVLSCTCLTHVVFFGASRYGMVFIPLLCALAATSWGRWQRWCVRCRDLAARRRAAIL